LKAIRFDNDLLARIRALSKSEGFSAMNDDPPGMPCASVPLLR